MKLILKTVFLTILCSLISACRNGQADEWLTQAESCMEYSPDSAYRCLCHIEDLAHLNDEQRARYALLRTQSMHKYHVPLENDSLINVAVAYYAGSCDRHRLALSLLYKGIVHKQNHQIEEAVEAFVNSKYAFEDVEDNQYKALLYNHYGSLLTNQGLYKEALTCYKESYRYNLLGDSTHYVISNCSQIANLFMRLEQTDSARYYYECGLSYADSLNRNKKNYCLLLQNYSLFLIKMEDYSEAEYLLSKCLQNLRDDNYIHSLYATLTTLYHEKGEFEKALAYGKQILLSEDSLTVCGGFLRLYNIYRAMGEMDSAFAYHNLYREYYSDITLRKQTANVAIIPHRMKSETLTKENRLLTGWRIGLFVCLILTLLVGWYIAHLIRNRHRRERARNVHEIAVKTEELEKIGNKYGETSAELGRLKGAMTNHLEAVKRIKKEHYRISEKYKNEIEILKKKMEELNGEIREMKEKDRTAQKDLKGLQLTLQKIEKELNRKTEQLTEAEHQREIDRRIEYFMMSGHDAVAVDSLLQMRQGRGKTSRFDIKSSEYLPLLKVLLKQDNPDLYTRMEECELDQDKRAICCLIALGLDDVEMMIRVTGLSLNSVKAYRRECEEAVASLL